MTMRQKQASVLDHYLDEIQQYRSWVKTLKPEHLPVGLDIVKTPGTVGGRARIDGTRIPVWLLASQFVEGCSVNEMLSMYPHLTERQVRSALRYFVDHEDEILNDIREQDE